MIMWNINSRQWVLLGGRDLRVDQVSFFGSDLNHNHYVSIEIRPAKMVRDEGLSNSWIFSENKYVARVRLTPNQWAEFISSPGMGDGVPCTIEYTESGRVDDYISVAKEEELAHNEFKKTMRDGLGEFEDLSMAITALLQKGRAGKSDLENLLGRVNKTKNDIKGKAPWIAEQFNESLDKAKTEARLEVESYIQNRIIKAGLNSLADEKYALSIGNLNENN